MCRTVAYVASLALILMSSGPALAGPAGIGTPCSAGELCLAPAGTTDCFCPEKERRQNQEAADLLRIAAIDLLSHSGSDCSCSPVSPGSGSERSPATSVSVHQFRMAKTKILPPFSIPAGGDQTGLALRCRSRLIESKRAGAEPSSFLLI